MTKPYGRKTKKRVNEILLGDCRETAMERLAEIPDEQLTGHLFAHFYHGDELIKFRSTCAMGLLVARIQKSKIEKARIVLRRIMWNLNDESGGIGWGSPEAMGEILSQSPELAAEFKSILFSYLDPGGNHIEHEILQRGVLWGIGTYLGACPDDLDGQTKDLLLGSLDSPDYFKRGYALRALANSNIFGSGDFEGNRVPEHILQDRQNIELFTGWDFSSVCISDIVSNIHSSGKNHKVSA